MIVIDYHPANRTCDGNPATAAKLLAANTPRPFTPDPAPATGPEPGPRRWCPRLRCYVAIKRQMPPPMPPPGPAVIPGPGSGPERFGVFCKVTGVRLWIIGAIDAHDARRQARALAVRAGGAPDDVYVK